MNQPINQFKLASIGDKFKRACLALDKLLASIDTEDAKNLRKNLRSGVIEYKQKGSLDIAFIGQYSAGKSTIISALTGRRDIHIDADIATDKTINYDWNGVRLIDTPGLFTDRGDHDEITYEAIDKADLLVFCLTYMLFDNITIANFKKLAYDKKYAWKIMLVINKMSDEAGEEIDKIRNYKKSLTDALEPQSLSDFQLCFIDAKEYCEGVDDNDQVLKDISRFDNFINSLNNFVGKRSSYSKLDTPIRIVLHIIDDTEKSLAPNDSQDAIFLEILRRLSRRVEQERDRLRTKVKGIQLEMTSAILAEGDVLVQALGSETFRELNEQSEIKVCEHYEKAETSLQRVIERAIESIRIEIEDELQKDLPQAFVARIRSSDNASKQEYTDDNFTENSQGKNSDFKSSNFTDGLKVSLKSLEEIANRAGGHLLKQATRGVLNTASEGQFLRSVDVINTNLHGTVKAVGKAVGYKFKPWEAVKITKNIGNAAKFLGPAVAFIGVASEGYAMYEENKRDQQLINIRRDIQKQFQNITVDLKSQFEQQLHDFEVEVYDDIQVAINHARQERESDISNFNNRFQELKSIRHMLMAALADVKSLATESL